MSVLTVFGNPRGSSRATRMRRNPAESYITNFDAWSRVIGYARAIRELIDDGDRSRVLREIESLRTLAHHMIRQVRGIRTNGRSGTLIGTHVQAVIYRHAVDGTNRVHGYGDADITPKDIRGGIQITGLKETTGVEMIGNADGTVTIRRRDGKPAWGMEEDTET